MIFPSQIIYIFITTQNSDFSKNVFFFKSFKIFKGDRQGSTDGQVWGLTDPNWSEKKFLILVQSGPVPDFQILICPVRSGPEVQFFTGPVPILDFYFSDPLVPGPEMKIGRNRKRDGFRWKGCVFWNSDKMLFEPPISWLFVTDFCSKLEL